MPSSEEGKTNATLQVSDTTSPAEIGQQTFPDEWNQQDPEIPLEAQLPQESHSHTYTPTALESPTAQERGPVPRGSAPQQSQSTRSTTPSNPAANEEALRRSMRHTKAPERLIEIFETEIERTNRHCIAYKVLAQPLDIEPDIDYMHPALAFAASSNPDVM